MDSAESENSKQMQQQSVFSTRSGIQDLLVRPDLEAEAPEPEKTEADNTVEPNAAPNHKEKKKQANKSKRQIERVKRRQKNYLQERRAQKRRQVLFGRIRVLFKLCFAVLFAVLLWETGQSPLWLYQKPLFSLKENHLIQKKQIEPFVRNWLGKPVYAINTGQLAQTVQRRFSVLDRVIIRRQMFPNRLEVLVTEHSPWAEIYADEKQLAPYALLMSQGVVNLHDYAYHSGLYNTTLDKILIPPHTVLTPEFLHGLQEIAWQARQVKGLHFDSVDARNQRKIVLNFREIPVILGPLNVSASERLSRLPALTAKILELREALDSVDLRWEEQVSFHKKADAQIVLTQDENETH